LESLDWRGFCKNGLQNLERVTVRGQNPENKGVVGVFLLLPLAAFASAMIPQLGFIAQG
jgi:hypothetical protein